MDELLQGLRAVAEPTRLRILGLCAHGELTVSDLTHILGQSQPRVSRHLKLMVDAGLLERFQEGQYAFYRISEKGCSGSLAGTLVDLLPDNDAAHTLDLERLEQVKQARAKKAEAYFRKNAAQWDEIRKLYVDDAEVEAALRRLVPEDGLGELLDIGTGTGRMIEVFADRYTRAVGIDSSREMLGVARTRLDRFGVRNWQVRQADMYALPLPSASFDTVTVHMVLHYAEQPERVIAEASRVLRPGGRLVIIDFAPHHSEVLRHEHAHRRLGFSDDEVDRWFRAAGLAPSSTVRLPGRSLTVCLWCGRRAANDAAAAAPSQTERSAP
ncbi:ArsR/SmtB family transcription factor [Ferruginivarius sediminum]|uniref:Methyltransferase domain-containing protein n=1 Tax=Ferruginivarius sediminum TaxID=2661937 RepID=A0A369TC36_9PROT|nr:metalloregulator ArsR/SmtB family transcription factor [Ferruginivarius sediminum]RDD62402.1 methyltransferase domain-containing protein [Ferruginivarius sediminum]